MKPISNIAILCIFPLNSVGQTSYTFSYDSHGNRVLLTYKVKNNLDKAMTEEELVKHFILQGVAKNVKFLQFVDIDKKQFQWIYVYDPNGKLALTPERYDGGCLINLQSTTIKGIYVISFCYNNFIYSYKISII